MNKQYKTNNGWRFRGNELKYVSEVLDHGFASTTTGSMNKRLEEKFCRRFHANYAITCNSGTSTLHQALLSFGVGPGDEVILSPLTVVMCAYAILYIGAIPVFTDIDPNTFCINPIEIEKKITKRTKAIMAVNLYGLVCDMDSIMAIAKKNNLYVLEDCAQCYLGKDSKGRFGGTIGDVGSFSLQSSKHLATGDGGVLITQNEILAERMRKFGGLGFKHLKADRSKIKKNKDLFQDPQYLRHDTVGWNYRMSELTAAVGLGQIENIDHLVRQRQKMAKKYIEVIKKTKCKWLIPQQTPPGYIHSYYTFVAKLETYKKKISWYDFRSKYMEFGGDGIYSAWALVYNEPSIQFLNNTGRYHPDIKTKQFLSRKNFLRDVNCPIAEDIQPKLLQFTTNQETELEMNIQKNVLMKTIEYFNS